MAEKNVKFYKTKDGTIVVCKDEFARQQIEQLQGIWEAIEELPDGQAVSAQVAIHTTEIAALQNGKANINGSYDSMTVGMAKNVEATSEISGTSLYRPTAGNADVADGVARVSKIYGNAVEWNQKRPTNFSVGAAEGITFTNENGVVVANGTATGLSFVQFNDVGIISGHKYYLGGCPAGGTPGSTYWVNAPRLIGNDDGNGIIAGTQESSYDFIRIYISSGVTANNLKFSVVLVDLSLNYGLGNEPTSVAAFKADYMRWFGKPLTYEPYNPGKLLAAKLLGLRTVGLNQFDEEWELGTISPSTGQNEVSSTQIRAKNYCRVIKGLTYYISVPDSVFTNSQLFFTMYDEDKNFIGVTLFNAANGWGTRIFPGNNSMAKKASYIRFYFGASYGTTYNHDICINLHYTNGRDGEYEPYEEHNYNFDTSKVYGKLNGEGSLVQVFPNGMKSAGSARDELTINGGAAKATKRVGSVDLGNLTWTYGSERFQGGLTGISSINTNLITPIYTTLDVNSGWNNKDKVCSLYSQRNAVYIKDTAYNDAAAFKTAMNGVLLFYELAEPAEYTDLVYRDNGVDTPIDALNILVSNYGTEEQIVESPTNGEPNSCAATLDILYGVNAADFMDAANNGAFVSKASLDALCNTLGSALGGTLTSTWNSAEGHYDFTFTPATRQIENPENNE